MNRLTCRRPFTTALWAVVTADGVNRTGCKHFDLHNPGQKEMDLER